MRSLAILFILSLALPGPALAAWVLERADLPDGSISLWATVDAAESPQTDLGTSMPGRLRLGCQRGAEPPGAFGVRLGWRPAARIGRQATVRYRVDGGAQVEEVWTASEGGDEVARTGADHVELAAALARGETVRLEVAGDGADALAWRVDLAAARPALVQVLAHCAGAPPGEDLSVDVLVGRWREAAQARARALRDAQARIREAAAARDRAVAAYADAVRRAVIAYWVPPERPRHAAVRVSLTVARDGRVLAAGLDETSDDAALDWSAVSALDKALEAGLPPLPPEVEGERLDLELVLDLPAHGRAR